MTPYERALRDPGPDGQYLRGEMSREQYEEWERSIEPDAIIGTLVTIAIGVALAVNLFMMLLA